MTEEEVKSAATIIIVSLFVGLFIGFILLSVYFSNLHRLLKYIEQNYPEKWKDLGAPTIFMGASPRSIMKTLRFIFSLEYDDDFQLKSLISKTKKSLIIYICYFILLAVLVIVLPILLVTGYLPVFH